MATIVYKAQYKELQIKNRLGLYFVFGKQVGVGTLLSSAGTTDSGRKV